MKDFKIFNKKKKMNYYKSKKIFQDELAGFNFKTSLKQVEVKIAEYIK